MPKKNFSNQKKTKLRTPKKADEGPQRLNAKQRRFVEEYLIDLNATQAAIRSGYSKKTARSQAQRLLTNVDIATAISEAQERRSKRMEVTADQVLSELTRIGMSDIRKLFTEEGKLRSIANLDDEVAAAIASVEVVTRPGRVDADGNSAIEYVHKIRLWGKHSALEEMGKHLGLFPNNNNHMEKDGDPLDREVYITIVSDKDSVDETEAIDAEFSRLDED